MRTLSKRIESIACWNVYIGQTDRETYLGLVTIITKHHPDAIALQEASDSIDVIKTVGRLYGYRVLVGKRAKGVIAGQESQSTVLLIRDDKPISRWGTMRMRLKWKGPKRGLIRDGRTFPPAVPGSPAIRITPIHMPTGKNSKRNGPAWRETIATLRNRAKRWRKRSVWLGDWNNHFADRAADSVRAFAKAVGGRIVRDDGSVDYAVVRGALEASMETYQYLGSDHRYFILTVRW